MTQLHQLYADVGALRAQMEAANEERQEMREDVKRILQIVSPLTTTLSEFKASHADFEQRIQSLEQDLSARRQRAKFAKRVAGWLGTIGGGGLGVALLRKMGLDIPDPN